MRSLSKLLVMVILALIVIPYTCLYLRWYHLWEREEPHVIFKIKRTQDDTIRVAMIGDSWAEKLHLMIGDAMLQNKIEVLIGKNVLFKSCGKGGEKSRGIYNYMFQSEEPGSKSLLSNGPDYCIVVVGINDAAANLGKVQYLHHYRLILNLLLKNGIRPVVVEIPNVDIWALCRHKPMKDLLSDFLRSTMTRCRMYDYSEYRKALYNMLAEEHLMDSIIYVPMVCWNNGSPYIDKALFDEDLIHLNRIGYEKFSSCLAEHIAEDLLKRVDSTFFNQPVSKDSSQRAKDY